MLISFHFILGYSGGAKSVGATGAINVFAALSPDSSTLYYTSVINVLIVLIPTDLGHIWRFAVSGTTTEWYQQSLSFAVNSLLFVDSNRIFMSAYGTFVLGTYMTNILTDFSQGSLFAWSRDLRWGDDTNWFGRSGKSFLSNNVIYNVIIFDISRVLLM